LPAHATTTVTIRNFLLVTPHKLIEDGLCHCEPTGLVARGVFEFVLGCGDHGKGPKDLIIVSFVLGLV